MTDGTNFARIVVDLSRVAVIDDQGMVALRFDDWKDNDSLRIDNLMVTGTVCRNRPCPSRCRSVRRD